MTDLYPTIDNVSSKYGAPMGRHPWTNKRAEGPVKLFRVPIDAGGYDAGGAYFGTGNPLWCATDEVDFRAFTRADTYELALSYFMLKFPFVNAYDRLPLGELLAGYIEAALFSSTIETEDQDSEHYDVSFRDAGYTTRELTPDTLTEMTENVSKFLEAIRPVLTPDFNFWRAGNVLWYASNGHGISWTDDKWGGIENALSAATPRYQDYNLFLTDDDKVGME